MRKSLENMRSAQRRDKHRSLDDAPRPVGWRSKRVARDQTSPIASAQTRVTRTVLTIAYQARSPKTRPALGGTEALNARRPRARCAGARAAAPTERPPQTAPNGAARRRPAGVPMNLFYYGDNLDVLRPARGRRERPSSIGIDSHTFSPVDRHDPQPMRSTTAVC